MPLFWFTLVSIFVSNLEMKSVFLWSDSNTSNHKFIMQEVVISVTKTLISLAVTTELECAMLKIILPLMWDLAGSFAQ